MILVVDFYQIAAAVFLFVGIVLFPDAFSRLLFGGGRAGGGGATGRAGIRGELAKVRHGKAHDRREAALQFRKGLLDVVLLRKDDHRGNVLDRIHERKDRLQQKMFGSVVRAFVRIRVHGQHDRHGRVKANEQAKNPQKVHGQDSRPSRERQELAGTDPMKDQQDVEHGRGHNQSKDQQKGPLRKVGRGVAIGIVNKVFFGPIDRQNLPGGKYSHQSVNDDNLPHNASDRGRFGLLASVRVPDEFVYAFGDHHVDVQIGNIKTDSDLLQPANRRGHHALRMVVQEPIVETANSQNEIQKGIREEQKDNVQIVRKLSRPQDGRQKDDRRDKDGQAEAGEAIAHNGSPGSKGGNVTANDGIFMIHVFVHNGLY